MVANTTSVRAGKPATACVFGFTGRMFDDTGLQNNLNRWYDPEVGRWLSEDPIGFDGRDGNVFRYVLNSPTNALDSKGLQTSPPTPGEISTGLAVDIGDVNGDHWPDYEFPDVLKYGYRLYSYSDGDFYVRTPNGRYVHRCPYAGGINNWSPQRNGDYVGSVVNPADHERITYMYVKGKLTIRVYDKDGKIKGSRTMNPPTKPEDLPFPGEVIHP